MQSSRKLTLPYFLPERNLILRNSSVIKYSVSTTLSPYPVSLTVAKILFLLILISLSISSLINHISSFHFQKQPVLQGSGVRSVFFFFSGTQSDSSSALFCKLKLFCTLFFNDEPKQPFSMVDNLGKSSRRIKSRNDYSQSQPMSQPRFNKKRLGKV